MSFKIAAFCIGLIIAIYWLRVLRMARKARRTNSSANFVPPEPIGRALRIIWIPIVSVWIAYPFVIALLRIHNPALQPIYATAWIAWPCAVGVFACFHFTRICWRIMGKNWRMGINPAEKNELVLTGPWSLVRHPIYALSQAMMLCTMIALPAPPLLIAGCLHLLLLQWEAHREELHLRRMHGAAYDDYCRQVGRFIPGV